jgi:hypothetical protein
MLEIEVNRDEIHFGASMTVRFMRTLRVPDDGREYSSLPTFGAFPIYSVQDHADRIPASWRARSGVFIPMYQREAMWISLSGRWWKPNAVKVGVGGVNALTAKPWKEELAGDPQDYLICTEQQRINGVSEANHPVRQFVAMPLKGKTAGMRVISTAGAIDLDVIVFEPKPGRFPHRPPHKKRMREVQPCRSPTSEGTETGLVASSGNEQRTVADPYGVDTWDQSNYGRLRVHIVDSEVFRDITGKAPSPTPVSTKEYLAAGLPWLDCYEEHGPANS